MDVELGSRYRAALTVTSVFAGGFFGLTLLLNPPLPLSPADYFLLAIYVGFLAVAQTFPVRLGDQSVTIALGIELPLFLQFGAVITVLSLLGTWLLSQWILGRSVWSHRTGANASLFSLVVLASAFAYKTSGGIVPIHWHGPLTLFLAPILIYVIVHFSSNYLITYIIEYARSDGRMSNWTISVLWDLSALSIELTMAGLFIFFQHTFGWLSLIYIAIPFAALIYVFRLYSNLLMANRQFSIISDLTVRLSVELRTDELLRVLLEGIPRLVSTTACYVFTSDENGALIPKAVRGPSAEIEARMSEVRVEPGQGITGTAYRRGKAMVTNSPGEQTLADRPFSDPLPTVGKSILAVPLRYNDQTLGVLTLTHVQKQAYTRRDLQMVKILAAQAAVGLWNAKRFALTEEQTYMDQLTELYNYRFFERELERLCRKSDQDGLPLTLLVLDLDHFKMINDSYGHLGGNEALRAVAQLIREQVREEDVICRYGGEEFTVILPGTTLETSLHIAERLRKSIEATPIFLPPMGNATPLPLRLTVSVGAATYPLMADSPLNLMRNADRAMYVGSKQKGRNRVAVYEW